MAGRCAGGLGDGVAGVLELVGAGGVLGAVCGVGMGAEAGAPTSSGAGSGSGSAPGRTSLGTSEQRTLVPRPGALTISRVAPMLDARSRMPSTP